jgi:hypothetical protein
VDRGDGLVRPALSRQACSWRAGRRGPMVVVRGEAPRDTPKETT